MKAGTAYALEVPGTGPIKVIDTIFYYEYQGQTLEYRVTNLADPTKQGEVGIIGVMDREALIGELHIPSTVFYSGKSYNVTYIRSFVFKNCDRITEVHIPEGVRSISEMAFYGCDLLSEVTMADSVEYLGSSVFANCKSIKSMQLSNKITSIPVEAFYECVSLEQVIMPELLTTIREGAFKRCEKLQSIWLTKSLIEIHWTSFGATNIVFTVDRDSYAHNYCIRNSFRYRYFTASSEETIALEDLIIKQKVTTLFPGENADLTLIYYPDNATTERNVIWNSNDTKVVTVDQNGTVTAKSSGLARIKAVVGTMTAECIVVVKPDAPSALKAVSTGTDSIKLTWEPVYGARSYSIYRSTSKNGDYKYVLASYIPSFKDRELKNNTTYYYKVIAYTYGYNYSAASHRSKVVSATTNNSVPVLAAKAVSNNQIKLMLSGIKGASGFQIYRATSKNGTYKLYKDITNDYFIDASVSKGKTYYYYAKAYYLDKNKKSYSDASKLVSAVAKSPSISKYVSLGTSRSDVYKIMGKPSYKYYDTNYNTYNLMYIEKKGTYKKEICIYLRKINGDYEVIGWFNNNSKMSDGDEKNTGTFTLGSSYEEVTRAMKTPTFLFMNSEDSGFGLSFQNNSIKYEDGSILTFNSDFKVIHWRNKGMLREKYGVMKPTKAPLTLGSTLDKVFLSLGTPDLIEADVSEKPVRIHYGNTMLYIDPYLRLAGWDNKGKINITVGTKGTTTMQVSVGSSVEDVIKIMGTPDSYLVDPFNNELLQTMKYGKKTIQFTDRRKVSKIIN
jgi:outer membrane protein assembly factor BamE (lipoprotein component of BamABCDE complex)